MSDAGIGDARSEPRWHPIDEAAGLWGVEVWSPAGWHWRSVALALSGSRVLVYAPLRRLDDAVHDQLAAFGTPAALLAPNHFHHLGLAEHVERYPDAPVVASPVAAPRVARKAGVAVRALDSERHRGGGDDSAFDLNELLPDHVTALCPPGLGTGEVWLRVETDGGVAWVVSDAFFNVRDNARGLVGLILRVTGTTPGLRIGRTFTGLAVARGGAYRDWLRARLARDRPRVLIPGHGEIARGDDLPDKLAALAEKRL